LKAVPKPEGREERKKRKKRRREKALELFGILRRPRLLGLTGSGHRSARKALHEKRLRGL
jgi:hypothetical protein